MVLDEATSSSSSDGFADSSYPSNSDPYGAPNVNEEQGRVEINLNDYPMPPPIIGGLVGYPRARVAMNVAEYLKAATHVLRRPLTKDEAQALTFHATKAKSTAAWGAAIGAGIGMYRCYATRKEYRFPFWSPTNLEGWNPEILGPLRGQAARVGYQLIRIPPYWFMGAFTAGILAQSYSTAIASIAMATDERLKALNEAIQQLAKNRNSLPGRQPAPNAPQPAGQAQSSTSDAYDDMSPTSGSYSDASSSNTSDFYGNQTRQQPASRWGQQQVTTQSSSFDDASPTGGLGPMDSGASTNESAWDRIRRQASGQTQSSGGPGSWASRQSQPEQKTGSTVGDSFAFSSSDEERQLAKSEAQKVFDERIDRERRGADFDDNGKKW